MKKCLFVFNPKSGKGKIEKNREFIEKELSSVYQLESIPSAKRGDIEKIVKEKAGNADLLVISGGDGSLNEAINGLMHLSKRPTVGYIPSGTVNDVAHSLRIPLTIKGAVKNILQGQPFVHDVIKAGERYGIYVACAGVFTHASYSTDQNVKKKVGKIAYTFNGAKNIFSNSALKLKLEYDGKVLQGDYALVLILNSRNVAGFHVNKKALLNDGKVDVLLVESQKDKVKLGALLKVVNLFLFGIRKKLPKGILHLVLDKFKIALPDDTPINLDGELSFHGGFDCEVLQSAIQIIVPNCANISSKASIKQDKEVSCK